MRDYSRLTLAPLFQAYQKEEIVKALIGDTSGNGHQVFVFGIPAYLPSSQVPQGTIVETGREIGVCVIKIMPETNNVVVSVRVAEEKRADKETENLMEGDIVDVRVKSIIDPGAIVQLSPGVDGIIYLKELSYSKIHSANDVVSVGDEFKAKIVEINYNGGKRRIVLSLKQASPSPWDSANYEVGQVVEGVVTDILDYGAFLNVGAITAMMHRSEITWAEKNPKPKEYLSVGDTLKVRVTSFDKEGKKMAVSLKGMKEDPWTILKIKPGDVIDATIVSKVKLGFFLGLPDGLQGLLYKSNLAWNKLDNKAMLETLQVGDTVRVLILSIDREKHNIELSMKHLEAIQL